MTSEGEGFHLPEAMQTDNWVLRSPFQWSGLAEDVSGTDAALLAASYSP
jgi:hypothetical protein